MQHFIRIIVTSLVLLASVSQAKHLSEETIDNRTSRVGQVNIEGMPKAVEVVQKEPIAIVKPEVATVATATESRTGEFLYNNICISCHGIGLANAPKLGDSEAWAKLLTVGINNLVSSAKKGKNVMPPYGACADCSDEELINAIHFMSGTN